MTYTPLESISSRIKIDLVSIIEVIQSAAQKAIAIYNSDFTVYTKEDKSPVTEADLQVNQTLIAHLSHHYPTHAVLSEEIAEDAQVFQSSHIFIIDPIDGTKEFVQKRKEWTINLALCIDKKIMFGIVYAPLLDEMYVGGKGLGSFLIHNNSISPINASDAVKDYRVATSLSHRSEKDTQFLLHHNSLIREVVSYGSSLKGCKVASGEVDIYPRFGRVNEWDIAAMHGVIEGAGAYINNWDFTEIDYNRGRGNHAIEKGVLVCNNQHTVEYFSTH